MANIHTLFVSFQKLEGRLSLLTVRLINSQFLLDSECRIPDPSSSPELTTTDPRTGRLASILYVPLELPQSSTKPLPLPPHVYRTPATTSSAPAQEDKGKGVSSVGVAGSSMFGCRRDGGGKSYEEPRKVPEHPTHSRTNSGAESAWNPGSLKGRIRASSVRHVSSLFLGSESDTSAAEETGVKRKWSLVKKTSGFFRGRNKAKTGDGDKTPQVGDHREMRIREVLGVRGNILSKKKVSVPSGSKHNVSDIVGYLRERSSSDLVYDLSRRSQPAKAYYHSPAVINTYSSVTEPRLQIPRSISDASKKSIETTATTDTFPSLSHSLASSYSCNDGSNYTGSPRANSAFSPEGSCSSDSEDDDAYEVETPIDGLGITTPYQTSERVYPKYYNFDEISGVPGGNRDIGKYSGDVILSEAPYAGVSGGTKPLACLREEVAGELAWREELVDELGYLGGVVV